MYTTKKGHRPRGGWGAEARRVERRRRLICRPETASYAGVYWEQVGRRGPCSKKTGWMVDIRISSPYLATGREHKVRKVTNAGTRLCSYVPETKIVVISEQYTLKTSNSREGILKMVSEFPPPGIIGAGKELASTILHEVILGDPLDDFVEILPGFKLKWTSAHAQKERGLDQSLRWRESSPMQITAFWISARSMLVRSRSKG